MSLSKDFFKFLMQESKEISFAYIIESTTGCKVFRLDNDEIVSELFDASKKVLSEVQDFDYSNQRPNEIGNDLDRRLREKLVGKLPKRKFAGYPDIIIERKKKNYYIEVKLANINQLGSRLGSFYYEPVKIAKVDKDAFHILVGFLHQNKRILGFKIVDLSKINVSLKNEFNANNVEIYKKDAILKEYPQTRLV